MVHLRSIDSERNQSVEQTWTNTVLPKITVPSLHRVESLAVESMSNETIWILQSVAEYFPDVLTIHDLRGKCLRAMGQLQRMLGWHAEDLEARSIFDFVHQDDLEDVRASWLSQCRNFDGAVIRYRLRVVRGDYRWVESHARCSSDRNCVVVTTRDIHCDMERQTQLEHDVSYDSLTGTFNRRALSRLLQAEWQRSLRNQEVLSLALFDVDSFKQINDVHGHAAGDELLRNLSSCVTRHKRTYDTLGRWGGDEFVLLLSKTAATEAEHAVRRILAEISRELPGVGVSFGVSSSRNALSPDELLAQADLAMYQGKKAGGGRVCAA